MPIPDTEQVIKKLYDELFHQLTLLAFGYIKDYSQAEEIVQDVFVKVWQNFEKVGQMKDKKAYMYKAVKNSSLNYNRHIKVRQAYISNTEASNTSFEKSPEEGITQAEINDSVHQAVNKLPDNWKEAFIKSKYDKLKYHEIAIEMKISQKTVEKYISKALKFLRNELKDLLIAGFIILKSF